MRNFIKLLAFAAVFAPTPGLAQDAAHRFTDRGVTYTYTVTPDDQGRQVIEGRSQPGGSQFRLVVDGERVQGVSGGQPVSFRAPKTSTGVAVAAR